MYGLNKTFLSSFQTNKIFLNKIQNAHGVKIHWRFKRTLACNTVQSVLNMYNILFIRTFLFYLTTHSTHLQLYQLYQMYCKGPLSEPKRKAMHYPADRIKKNLYYTSCGALAVTRKMIQHVGLIRQPTALRADVLPRIYPSLLSLK